MSTAPFLQGMAPRAAEELKENLKKFATTASSALNGVSDAAGLSEKVNESPYGMALAAIGVGYVLGGGLFTSTTVRMVRLGARVAAIPVVRDRLIDAVEAAVDGLLDSTAAAPAAPEQAQPQPQSSNPQPKKDKP
jgi:hypothetical protein